MLFMVKPKWHLGPGDGEEVAAVLQFRRLHQWPKHLVSFMNTFRRPIWIEGGAHAQNHFFTAAAEKHIHRQSPQVLNTLLANSISPPACILFPFINSHS